MFLTHHASVFTPCERMNSMGVSIYRTSVHFKVPHSDARHVLVNTTGISHEGVMNSAECPVIQKQHVTAQYRTRFMITLVSRAAEEHNAHAAA
jgi:hypothetical protein